MKHRSHSKTRSIALVAAFLIAAFQFTSCTKKNDSGNDAAKFVGTWNGSSSCGGSSPFTLSAGSDGTTLTQAGSAGSGSCAKAISVVISASGNNLTAASQTVTDLCGHSYTISGYGTLNGNTLTFTETASGNAIPTTTCTFTGTK